MNVSRAESLQSGNVRNQNHDQRKANNMRHLSEEQRVEIVALKRAGLINAQIARRVKCSPSTVQQVLHKFHKYHTVQDLPKPGRPKVLGRWERQQLRNGIYRNEFDNAEEARRNLALQCSTRTVRRELARMGAKKYAKQAKSLLTDEHKRRRVEFAKEHRS